MNLIINAALLPRQDREHMLPIMIKPMRGLLDWLVGLFLLFGFWLIWMLPMKGLPFGPLTVLETPRATVPTPLLF